MATGIVLAGMAAFIWFIVETLRYFGRSAPRINDGETSDVGRRPLPSTGFLDEESACGANSKAPPQLGSVYGFGGAKKAAVL